MIDVDCMFTGVLVLRTHQKGAAEAFVRVNYSTCIKQQNRRSSPWMGSAGWQFAKASKPPPAVMNRCVCVCVCIFVSRVANKAVCLCSLDFPVFLTVVSHNTFDSRQIKKKVSTCVRAANRTVWTHFIEVW